MTKKYFPADIETKWQEVWAKDNLYKVEDHSDKPKKYVLDMFPYPSGEGLHVGHFKIYSASDVLARFYRMNGFNVLHPMGWDAFGLPAENFAIKNKVHPKVTTARNITNIKRQMQMVGFSYDWSREINTTEPDYYKWTQWIFLKLFEHGLAYESNAPINWCPKDQTGLANEEVINGHCERCGTQVERRPIRQWILAITKYADRLAEDVTDLDWPQFIKDMQVNWIGKSQGTRIQFEIENSGSDTDKIEAFTTRIDTVFGVTALVLAPEHPMVDQLTTAEHKESVGTYIAAAQSKSDLERTELNKEKTGVFIGSYAINPVNNERIPIWIADYVLGFYGTGAVMFVPAHDERDFEFAEKFNLPIVTVIEGKGAQKSLYLGSGKLINSGDFNGLDNTEAKTKITEWLKEKGQGDFEVNYKLRDWIFSRQRYWGEPIPLIHCEKCGIVPVPEDQLPVKLPETDNYLPTGTGESPLAAIEDWVNVDCPKCGGPAKRETNTMPQWAGSCWYYLRFADPHNKLNLISKDIDKYWIPIDWYIGGAEHAVLHLLYARFWHKFLYDIKVVSSPEPFMKLSSVGLVLAADGRKMSKSLGNVVSPDDIVKEYGADSLRVYEYFMGPFENAIAWDPTSINGVHRFLSRAWEVVLKPSLEQSEPKVEAGINKLITKVASDVQGLKLNTAIAAMMEFINLVYNSGMTQAQKAKFLIVLAPFAPHITEELWHELGNKESIHLQSWPTIDESAMEESIARVMIQVNGKVRGFVEVSKNASEEDVKKMAMENPATAKYLDGTEVKKAIYVKGKIINFVL